MARELVSSIHTPAGLERARAAFYSVFQVPDTFGAAFQERIVRRDLIYPVGFCLDGEEFAALGRAASELGQRGVFISTTEGHKLGEFSSWSHWEVDLESYPYGGLQKLGFVPLVENAIYSQKGDWGLVISHEQHALVGGPPDFVERLKSSFPGPSDHLAEFLEYWKENRGRFNADVSWIEPFLSHLYGDEEAARIMWRSRLRT